MRNIINKNLKDDSPFSTSTFRHHRLLLHHHHPAKNVVSSFCLVGIVVTATPCTPSSSQGRQSCGRAAPGSCPPNPRGAPPLQNKTHTKEILAIGSGPVACPPATCCFAQRSRRKCLPHPILRVRTVPTTPAFSQTATHLLRYSGSFGCFVFHLKAEEY